MKTLVSLVAVGLLAGCSSDDMTGSQGSLDQPFRVGYAQHVTIQQEDLTLSFTQLNDDGRCPAGSVCIIAGSATITITVSKDGAVPETRKLTIGEGGGSGSVAAYLDYTITLVKLEPYPVDNGPRNPNEYIATLVVTKI
jgi:hypothetical protein